LQILEGIRIAAGAMFQFWLRASDAPMFRPVDVSTFCVISSGCCRGLA